MISQQRALSVVEFKSTKSQMERVSGYLTRESIDLTKRFDSGTYQIIADAIGLSYKQVKACVRVIRKQKGIGTGQGDKSASIRKCIKETGVDITKRLDKGTKEAIADLTGATVQQVTNIISTMRKHTKRHIYTKVPAVQPPSRNFPNTFVDYCVENNLTRANPNSEREACNGLCKIILNELPRGGVGMIIGTPTAFCASCHERHKLFLTDNLKVAHMLDMTTDHPPIIVIGNAVDPVKAELKAFHWLNNNTTNHFTIETGIVDKISYTHHITKLAEKHDLCKVILMGSGVWTGSTYSEHKWKGFDFDFRSPSEYLITRYKNLHIVAMTLLGGEHGNFHYIIKHLYHGMKLKKDD